MEQNKVAKGNGSIRFVRTGKMRMTKAAKKAQVLLFCASLSTLPYPVLAQSSINMPQNMFMGGSQASPGNPGGVPNPLSGTESITPQMLNPTEGDKATSLIGLVAAFDESLTKHPRVASVRAQLGIAKALYAQALTLPNPSILVYQGMRAEQTYQRGVSIPIEPPWKIVTRIISAKQQIKQSDLQIMNSLWLLRLDVRRAFMEVVVAQETAQTLADLKSVSSKLLNVAQKRFQAGDVPELDVLKARLATTQAELDHNQGLRRVIQAKQQLNVMLGRNFEEGINVQRLPILKAKVETNDLLPDFNKPIPPVIDYVKQALQDRLDLKVIEQQIKANQAGRNNSIGNIIPNFQMNVGNSATGNPPSGPKIKNGYFIGISQEVPITNWQQGDIANFNATIKQLKLELVSQKNVITGQVAAAYQKLVAARERIKAYREHVLDDSNEVVRLARRSYEVGQSDITSTLAAQHDNITIQSQYLDAVQAYQQAFADLEQAVGKPLQ